ncbi:MAG: hypothetical protein SVY53_05195 [Chloroflexota bacterium]|nr:hypothetical protein [Chloroflexota bacterium]
MIGRYSNSKELKVVFERFSTGEEIKYRLIKVSGPTAKKCPKGFLHGVPKFEIWRGEIGTCIEVVDETESFLLHDALIISEEHFEIICRILRLACQRYVRLSKCDVSVIINTWSLE